MAEFRLGRIRFVWKDEWEPSKEYFVDDVVRYGGKVYICQAGHISNVDFYTDLDIVPTKWDLLADGSQWRNQWDVEEFYRLGDIVKYGTTLYICNTPHTSNSDSSLSLEADQEKWDLYASGLDWKGEWSTNVFYKKNDLVKYGGITYVCNTTHTSAGTENLGLEDDQAKWDPFNQGLDFKGNWVDRAIGTRFKINDIVKFGAGLFIATAAHNKSATFETDAANWSQFVEGIQFENEWDKNKEYQQGDIVVYGGYQYIAKTTHSGQTPTQSLLNWDLFSTGFKFENVFEFSTPYRVGSVLRQSGYTYIVTSDINPHNDIVTATSSSDNSFTISTTENIEVGFAVKFVDTTIGGVFSANDSSASAIYYVQSVIDGNKFTITDEFGGSVFVPSDDTGSMPVSVGPIPPNSDYFGQLNSGIRWQGEWIDDTEYFLGDAVRYGSNAYICVKNHRSNADDDSTIGPQGGGSANSRPDLDVTGTFWNLIAVGDETSVLQAPGDLVYYGGAGPARLPIGVEGQLLRVGPNQAPEWVTLGQSINGYYVAEHGVDGTAPVHGLSLDKPFRTIRHAAEQVEKGIKVPNTRELLEKNREFIKREVTEYVIYEIDQSIAPFDTFEGFDDSAFERDIGFIIDAIVFDLTHGGNSQIREETFETLQEEGQYKSTDPKRSRSTLTIVDRAKHYTSSMKLQYLEAIAYLNTLIDNVLDQVAPEVNYQVLNGDNSSAIVEQYFNPMITAETEYTTNPFSGSGYSGSGLTTGGAGSSSYSFGGSDNTGDDAYGGSY
jgi:hypothetical protein